MMTVLWCLGEGTVADVLGHLPKQRKLAYTSVSTILRILEEKKVVKPRKEGRGHIYVPIVKRKDYEAHAVSTLVKKVFNNDASALVKNLLKNEVISEDEKQKIRDLLDGLGK